MPTVKTAISLDQDLFLQVGELAHTLKLSRSRVFALAMEDFMKRRRSDLLTQQLNQVYADGPSEEEQQMVRGMRQTHRQLTEGEW